MTCGVTALSEMGNQAAAVSGLMIAYLYTTPLKSQAGANVLPGWVWENAEQLS